MEPELELELIGTIVRLQVQEVSLKIGQRPRSRYDPAPLRTVPALLLAAAGVTGLDEPGDPVPDVHHRDHPASKNRACNGLSVCFTSHYDAMRARFGPHLVDGLAGENILVQTNRRFAPEEVAPGLLIETARGDRLPLDEIIVAVPCVEFTRFALHYPDDARPDHTVTEALAFLNDGMRGFYATPSGAATRIELGDRVFLVP